MSSISDTSTVGSRCTASLPCHPSIAGTDMGMPGEEVSHGVGVKLESKGLESKCPLEAVSGLRPSHSADATVTSRPEREAADLRFIIQGLELVSNFISD